MHLQFRRRDLPSNILKPLEDIQADDTTVQMCTCNNQDEQSLTAERG